MEWTTLAATVLGAAIGVGSTWLADQSRWRRTRSSQLEEIRRGLYSSFLAAVAGSWNDFHAVVVKESLTWPERAELINAAYHESEILQLRYQLATTAPADIVHLVDATYRSIRNLVNRIIEGETYDGWDDLRTQNQEMIDSFEVMRSAMRRSILGASQ